MTSALQHQAQHLAALLPPLLVEAERIAAAVRQGLHGRRRRGLGESFWQFRPYSAEDTASRIDWRQSARSDKLFVREREWEAAQSVYLWADKSGSMQYRSQKTGPTKAERAQVLMLALADLLIRGGERPIWLAAEPIAIENARALEHIAAHVESNEPGDSQPPSIRLPRHAHLIICSDFLTAPGETMKMLRRYAALNTRGVALHILDPAEENLPFTGRVELHGCEHEAPLLVANAAALRAAYRARMQAHKASVLHIAQSAGWFYQAHVTDKPAQEALLQLFNYLAADRRGL